ncbi:MAG: hypothetical protein IKD01_05350 [Oscillospiraceae bacterium]|nr:hypothetical protein [Oscillospiraceae bacterium]
MTEREKTVLDGLKQMEAEAPSVGLCVTPFRVIREELERVYAERDGLMAYREPKRVLPDKRYFGVGVCPSCGAVFLACSTNYCGNCGQAITFHPKEAE